MTEPHLVVGGERTQGQQVLGERHRRLRGTEHIRGAGTFREAALRTRDHGWMAVAQQGRTGCARKVQHLAAIFLDQAVAPRIPDGQRISPQLADTGKHTRIALKQ